jgi:deoxyribodipyrimidine photolyase-related protein
LAATPHVPILFFVATLIPVLGDQLSPFLASLRGVGRRDAVVLMAEVAEETGYVRHHKQKIAMIFSAMRHFARALEQAGWTVDYVRLNDPGNSGSFTGEVARAITRHAPSAIRIVEAGEWRVRQMLEGWQDRFGLPVEILPDDRFLSTIDGFQEWAAGRATLTMEYFYRDMRRRHGVLMDGSEPAGGRWNFDADNRKTPPRGLNYPALPDIAPDAITREVLALVAERFAGHFGDLAGFGWPVTRDQALALLDHFVAVSLPRFGDYQDAMLEGQDLLYHSALSVAMNCGLLIPREAIDAAEAAYRRGDAPLNAVEGYIRQILGWREYVRGLYWLDMPGFATANALEAGRPLPDFYWTAETDMRCLHVAVDQTRRGAYAHHIQRLMVLGNFAMLAGVAPQAISDWFLVVYADAYEWVELPNVIGMSQYADGGRLGSKPYAAGGAYIDRMSDHCGRCRYDVKQKTGPDACPFNALYWDFIARHADRFRANPRMRNVYRNWDRFGAERQAEYRASAATFLATLEPARPGWAKQARTG